MNHNSRSFVARERLFGRADEGGSPKVDLSGKNIATMASYATVPAEAEAEKPLLNRDVRVNLKTVIGGAQGAVLPARPPPVGSGRIAQEPQLRRGGRPHPCRTGRAKRPSTTLYGRAVSSAPPIQLSNGIRLPENGIMRFQAGQEESITATLKSSAGP